MLNAYELFGISKKIENLSNEIEQEYNERFNEIEKVSLYNQAKVLKAFNEANVTQSHFGKTTGYGYGDIGREKIEEIYSKVFKAEDALVRVQFVNGTHAIATTLKGLLMPNDTMLAVTGRPYDTICETIGITKTVNPLSLKSYGVKYEEIDLNENGEIDIPSIKEYISNNKVKLIHIQRSRGYALRKAFRIKEIEEVIKVIKEIDKGIIVMVDNCYGEFVEEKEPIEIGADIICGSLIKNIGGGFCETGGYVARKKRLSRISCSNAYMPWNWKRMWCYYGPK